MSISTIGEGYQTIPQLSDVYTDPYSEDLFDPLGAIDFSNFTTITSDPNLISGFL